MATPPLVTWQFADWRSQGTSAAQLERLKRHMEEVSGFVLQSQAKGRGLTLDSGYMPMLQSELIRLEGRVTVSRMTGRFGVSSYVRGSGS